MTFWIIQWNPYLDSWSISSLRRCVQKIKNSYQTVFEKINKKQRLHPWRWGLLTWRPPGGGGGAVGRKVEQHGAPIPTLPPEQKILQEEEVRTPPRREARGHGGHRAPEPQLMSVPDVVGLVGRRPDAMGSRILRGRDVCSIHVLVPDARGLDHNLIVDMGDEPEASVSLPELSALREQWPPAVFRHMVWLQQDLELMRADAKKRFRQSKPTPCVYCGRVIKCDMYRHVTKFHLVLAQLWRCPVSWCTVWKGNPQDSMDHVRGVHDIPWIVKTANLEQFVPPWTVHRQHTLGYRPTFRCSVTSTCRWHTTTGSTGVGFRILPFGRTTCQSYRLFCQCRWCCPQLRCRRRLSWEMSLRGGRDVLSYTCWLLCDTELPELWIYYWMWLLYVL